VKIIDIPSSPVCPKPPRMTFGSERFIALHMMYDRIAPEEPISAPTMVIKLLFSMNPSAHKAQPEYELRTVMTTGMSAPPMAEVKVIPMMVEREAVAPRHAKPLRGRRRRERELKMTF
jgi:hypothetical protein